MHRSVLKGNDIHNGAQLDCAVSYAAQHLQVLRVVDLDLWMRFALLPLLLPRDWMRLQSEGASHLSHQHESTDST